MQSLIHDLTHKPKGRIALFASLPLAKQEKVIHKLSKRVQAQLLTNLEEKALLDLLTYVDPDIATDLLQSVPKLKQDELLMLLNDHLQKEISLLLQFDPKTAAGLMSLNYIRTTSTERVSEITKKIRLHEERTGKFPLILVSNGDELLGYLPNHKLIFAQKEQQAQEFVEELPTLPSNMEYKKVIQHFLNNPHGKTAIIGESNQVIGILYSEDVLRAIRDHEATTLYDFAGVTREETVFDSISEKVGFRYKWLIINLGTAFLASATVSLFNETISKYVLLAVYMPIVAGMGGNSATQTLAVLVRGIALQQIDLKTSLPALKREMGAALVNGLINGVLVATIVVLFNKDVRLAIVLALAMVCNLLVAGFFGTMVPLIMSKLGKDPAASATIFITTATDVLGFLVFLGLATLFLQ
jgi:magnesium transporter